MAKVIEPCDDPRGHFWRPVDGQHSQCSRCWQCANDEDFHATAALRQEESNGK